MRSMLTIGILVIWVACDSTKPATYEDVAGIYDGTVEGSGGILKVTGNSNVTVVQAEDSIGGDIILDLKITGIRDSTMTVKTTFTGSVAQGTDPHAVLIVTNPQCGGASEFEGGYTSATSSIALTGQYALKEPSLGCRTVATFDIMMSARRRR